MASRVEWLADRKLAIAGDHGVAIVDLGGAATPIARRRDGLVDAAPQAAVHARSARETSRVRRRPTGVGDEATDAGVDPTT